MKAQRVFPAPETLLCCLLLFQAPLSSQRPETPGRLTVRSTPPAAIITIDDQDTNQVTPFTFVVSPGDHSVSLKSPSLPDCKKPKKVTVSSGAVTSVSCTAEGWGEPTSK